MLIRVILIAVAIYLAIAIYKRLKKGVEQKTPDSPRKEIPDQESMHQCAYCKIHLPEHECTRYQTLYFCNLEHQQKYLESDNRDT